MANLTYDELLTELSVVQAFMDKFSNHSSVEYKELETDYGNILHLLDIAREVETK